MREKELCEDVCEGGISYLSWILQGKYISSLKLTTTVFDFGGRSGVGLSGTDSSIDSLVLSSLSFLTFAENANLKRMF